MFLDDREILNNEGDNMTEQEKFNQTIEELLTVDRRMTPDQWNELFVIFEGSEKAGLNLNKLSPITKFNYNNWKKKQ